MEEQESGQGHLKEQQSQNHKQGTHCEGDSTPHTWSASLKAIWSPRELLFLEINCLKRAPECLHGALTEMDNETDTETGAKWEEELQEAKQREVKGTGFGARLPGFQLWLCFLPL